MSQSTRKWVIVESTTGNTVSVKPYDSQSEAQKDIPTLMTESKNSGTLVVRELLQG